MKGFLYIFEAVIAGIIIIGFLIAASSIQPDSSLLADKAYEILLGLDEQNQLRAYAENMDAEGLNSKIDLPGYSHTVQICSQTGCSGQAPADQKNVFVGRYFISGKDSYKPAEVKVYVWK